MDVVAKVTGATGGGKWTVKLRNVIGTTLAEVEFLASDTSFALRTGALAWPDSDLDLRDLRLELIKTNATDLTGTIDIRKAAVKIHQQGRIKATVGRVPLASFHDQITSTTFADLADGSRYKHVSADFAPAPTAMLRLTAKSTIGTGGTIRIIDDATPTPNVVDVAVDIGGPANQPTIALENGRTYRLQAKADSGSVLRVYSADLVLEQSTTDELGLTKSVGWYPSITTPVDADSAATGAAQMLRTPALALFRHSFAWLTVAKTSSNQQTKVALQEVGGSSYAETTTSLLGYTLLEEVATGFQPGTTMDSRTQVVRPGGTAIGIPGQTRVASSTLRLAAQLRDIVAPTFTVPLTATPAAINPDPASANPNKTSVLTATVKDDSFPVTWAIDILPPGGGAPVGGSVGQLTTSTAPPALDEAALSWTWNGKVGSTPVADGTYTARLTLTDNWENVTTAQKTIVVDKTPPVISNLVATPAVFNPSTATTQISTAAFEEGTRWVVEVRNPADTATIKRFPTTGSAGPSTTLHDPVAPAQPLVWNGRDGANAIVSDDNYKIRLTLTDATGNVATNAATPLVVGVNGLNPVITGAVLSNTAFSPVLPAANPKSKTTVTATLSERSDWTVTVSDRTFTGTGTAINQTWDGRNAAGQVVDGDYTLTVNATDIHGSIATPVSWSPVTVDTVSPVIANLTATPALFNPVADEFTELAVDAFEQSGWLVQVRNAASVTVRSFSGSGTTLFDPAAPTQPLRWNGRNTSNTILIDGDYTIRLSLTDPAGNSANNYSSPVVVGVECCVPVISGAVLSNPSFSPVLAASNPKSKTTLAATISELSDWSVAISDRTFTGTGTAISVLWDGRNAAGQLVADGSWTFTVAATDTHDASAVPVEVTTTVDTVGPALSQIVPEGIARLSPNGDGAADSATFGAQSDELAMWELVLSSDSEPIRTIAVGPSTVASIAWNGANDVSESVVDGLYAWKLLAVDAAGNPTNTEPGSVIVDKTAPSIDGFSRTREFFSPAVNETVLTAHFEDGSTPWTPFDWEIEITSEDSSVRLLSGTSTDGSIGGGQGVAWDGADADGEQVADGLYVAELRVSDGGGNVAIHPEDLAITVDTVVPALADSIPQDHGNTVFGPAPGQPLGVRLIDEGGSGVADETVRIGLVGGTTYPRAALVSHEGWLKTVPHVLVKGTTYTAEAWATDRAGNETRLTWTFRAIGTPAADPARAYISGSGTKLPTSGGLPGHDLWRFEPRLDMDPRAVWMDEGSAHPGFGTVTSTVDLSQAVIQVTVGGVKSDWPIKPYSAGTTRDVYHQLAYDDVTGLKEDVRVLAGTYLLDSVDMDLPANVSEAALVMNSDSSGAFDSLCADPTVALNCSPDPMFGYASDALASRKPNPPAEDQPTDVVFQEDSDVVYGISRLLPDPADANGGWNRVTVFSDTACVPGPAALGPVCLVNDVYYQRVSPVVPIQYQNQFCLDYRFCTYAAANDDGGSLKYRCVEKATGKDMPPGAGFGGNTGSANERCQQLHKQLTGQGWWTTAGGKTFHQFFNYWSSDWGFEDGNKDQIGVHWATGKKDLSWTRATTSEMTSIGLSGQPSAKATYKVTTYPENSPGNPTEQAKVGYQSCWVNAGKGTLAAEARQKTRADGTLDHGVAIGTGQSAVGFPQFDSSCGNAAYFRAEEATVWAVVRQTSFCGSACGNRDDGTLVGTWDHARKSVDLTKLISSFVISAATSCTGRATCNPYAIIFIWAVSGGATYAEEEDFDHHKEIVAPWWNKQAQVYTPPFSYL